MIWQIRCAKLSAEVFHQAKRVIDRFHVQKLAYDALQEMRIAHRWDASNEETDAMEQAKFAGRKYKAQVLEKEFEKYRWNTFDDIYQTCVEKWTNKNTLKYKRNMLPIIKRFTLESAFPDREIHAHRASYYDSLSDDFKSFIDTYCPRKGFSVRRGC